MPSPAGDLPVDLTWDHITVVSDKEEGQLFTYLGVLISSTANTMTGSMQK